MREISTWPAAPGNNATILLWNQFAKVPAGGSAIVAPQMPAGMAPVTRVVAVSFYWIRNDQASAANGLRCYVTDNKGVTWYETDLKNDADAATIGSGAPIQVPALAAGAGFRRRFVVSDLAGVAFEYTAGATGPTNWNGVVVLDLDNGAVVL